MVELPRATDHSGCPDEDIITVIYPGRHESVHECCSNEIHALIAHPSNSAQLEGTPTIPQTYIAFRTLTHDFENFHTAVERPWYLAIMDIKICLHISSFFYLNGEI